MTKPKPKNPTSIHIKNKKAFFNYEILKKYTAGLVLKGPEIKSIRMGKANLTDAYCYFTKGELWAKGIHITTYKPASYANHDPDRVRKLLLHKKELNKLKKEKQEKSYTIVPLQLFINTKGWAKLDIALAKGKKNYDKRAAIKERDLQRSEAI
ncbi:MAG: SsrA-binding protein SmpB [Bacteroidota bacterium]